MIKKKEELFKQYLLVTEKTLEVVHQSGQEEEVLRLLDERDALISDLKMIDFQSGESVVSEEIREIISRVKMLDEQLINAITLKKDEALRNLNSLNNAKALKEIYTQRYELTDGAFYDKRQ